MIRVAVVSEYYPRRYDPVLGIWAHRQALAARDAGAEIEVFVLHRLIPPSAAPTPRELLMRLRQPRHDRLDGLPVHYVPFVSPRRSRHYARWGAWSAPALRRALARRGRFDVLHAHNAVPAGDALLRCDLVQPLVVSVHGGDVLWTSHRVPGGGEAVRGALSRARLVLANSAGIAALAHAHGATEERVVHLGTDVPEHPPARAAEPLLCTVGHLVARKRHADVLEALALLPPRTRYLVIGDGPERGRLEALAAELGVRERVEFAGQLEQREALRRARAAWLFVMPSTEEAFGVAYVEAMAAGIPAVGAAGEPGPQEIGAGLVLVPPRDPGALAAELGGLLGDPARLDALGHAARETVRERFTWERCGRETLAAYEEAAGG